MSHIKDLYFFKAPIAPIAPTAIGDKSSKKSTGYEPCSYSDLKDHLKDHIKDHGIPSAS